MRHEERIREAKRLVMEAWATLNPGNGPYDMALRAKVASGMLEKANLLMSKAELES